MKMILRAIFLMVAISLLLLSFNMTAFANSTIPESLDDGEIFIPGYHPDPASPCFEVPGHPLIQVSDPSTFPYKAIAYVSAYYGDCGHSAIGTGFMISENCMMTAAHVLKCTVGDCDINGSATFVSARFGYVDETDTHYALAMANVNQSGEVIYTCPDHGGDGDYEDDWGYVIFNEQVGLTTEYFGIYVPSISNIVNMPIAVSGYEYDSSEDEEINPEPDGIMYKSTGNIISATTEGILYDASSVDGISGSPVFVMYNGYWSVIGINSGFVGTNLSLNRGKRFTAAMVNHLSSAGYIPETNIEYNR